MEKLFSEQFWEKVNELPSLSKDDLKDVIQQFKNLNIDLRLAEKLAFSQLKQKSDNFLKKQLDNKDDNLDADKTHFYADPVFILSDEELPYFKDDLVSMEYPLFALRTGDTRTITYETGNKRIIIRPLADLGRATILDKDIWIFIISRLMQAKDFKNLKISKTVEFTAKDFLNKTFRGKGGKQYELLKASLNRLSGTQIETNIETGNKRISRGFGLLESWEITETGNRNKGGFSEEVPLKLRVTVPDWLFNAIQANEILQINPEYFRLKKPVDRRIYEIARKHCGQQIEWRIHLNNLYKKTGSRSNVRTFKMSINKLIENQPIPDYSLEINQKTNIITFKNLEKIAEAEKNAKK